MHLSGPAIVLLFMKAPVPGKVKSRLSAEIGPGLAGELYANFVLDTVEMLRGLSHPLRIYYAPADALPHVSRLLGTGYDYAAQKGADLGERMARAFEHAFAEGIERVVLIGSDIPDLPAGLIDTALSSLTEKEAVLGPAYDGGYYLIGFRRQAFLPQVFQEINWSTPRVLQETTEILTKAGRSLHLLPEWSDVDSLADLHLLLRRNTGGIFERSRTMVCLKNLLQNSK